MAAVSTKPPAHRRGLEGGAFGFGAGGKGVGVGRCGWVGVGGGGAAETHAFTVMTMPCWQCIACAQYRNMGCVFMTGTLKVPTMPLAPPSKGMKPLWMPGAAAAPGTPAAPASTGRHGEFGSDCVTVWLRAANWNCSMSPGLAVTLFGVKVRAVPPTSTGMTLLFGVDEGASGHGWLLTRCRKWVRSSGSVCWPQNIWVARKRSRACPDFTSTCVYEGRTRLTHEVNCQRQSRRRQGEAYRQDELPHSLLDSRDNDMGKRKRAYIMLFWHYSVPNKKLLKSLARGRPK